MTSGSHMLTSAFSAFGGATKGNPHGKFRYCPRSGLIRHNLAPGAGTGGRGNPDFRGSRLPAGALYQCRMHLGKQLPRADRHPDTAVQRRPPGMRTKIPCSCNCASRLRA